MECEWGGQVPSESQAVLSPVATRQSPFFIYKGQTSATHHPTKTRHQQLARRCPAKMAGATVRRPSYKDVLQPALHRRFTTTALILGAIAYVCSILLGRWNSCG